MGDRPSCPQSGCGPDLPARSGRSDKTLPLEGKNVVVTGTLERHSRKEIEDLIKQLGGKAAGSISRKTDYVVAGESAGSKLAKARQLGVTVLSEAEFEKLAGG